MVNISLVPHAGDAVHPVLRSEWSDTRDSPPPPIFKAVNYGLPMTPFGWLALFADDLNFEEGV
jgi:hypothetical protein